MAAALEKTPAPTPFLCWKCTKVEVTLVPDFSCRTFLLLLPCFWLWKPQLSSVHVYSSRLAFYRVCSLDSSEGDPLFWFNLVLLSSFHSPADVDFTDNYSNVFISFLACSSYLPDQSFTLGACFFQCLCSAVCLKNTIQRKLCDQSALIQLIQLQH